jgi:hypothetical protein
VIRFGHLHQDGAQSEVAVSVLLRESYRDKQGRAQKRMLANLSKLPAEVIDGLRALLKGGAVIGTGEMQIERSLPHGHVAAALGMLRKIALDRLILSTAKDTALRRHCDLAVAMIVDRLITPRSKLGFVRAVASASVSRLPRRRGEQRDHLAHMLRAHGCTVRLSSVGAARCPPRLGHLIKDFLDCRDQRGACVLSRGRKTDRHPPSPALPTRYDAAFR